MAFQSLLALSLIRIVPKTNFLPHIVRSRALSASLPRLASTEPPTAIPIKLASARPAEGDIQTLYNNGLNSFNRGDFEDAQRWFRKAIKVEPGSSDSHYNLGNALLSLGRIDEALQSYQTSLKLKPTADVLVNMANLFALHRKDWSQAALNYEAALRIEEDPQTRFNYAVVLDQGGQLDKAVEQYRIALKGGILSAEKYLRNAIVRLAAAQKKEDGDK